MRDYEDRQADRVTEIDKEFACRNAPMPDLSNEKIFPGGINVKALFTPDMKWRLVEEFGPHCFITTDDGRPLKMVRHLCLSRSLSPGDREPAILLIRKGI